MNCSKHHEREAKGMCVRCNRLICEECAVKINNKYYCKECVSEMYSTDNKDENTHNNNRNNIDSTNDINFNNSSNDVNYTNESNLNNKSSDINEINNGSTNKEQLDLEKINSYTNVSDNLNNNSNNNLNNKLNSNSNENLYINYQTQEYKDSSVRTDRRYKEVNYVLAIIAIALLIPKVVLAIGGFPDCFENMYLSIRYDDGVRALFFFINSLLILLEPLIIIALAALSFKNFMKLKKIIRIIAPIVVVAVFTLLIFITGNIALRFIYISPFISMLSYIIPVALIVIGICLEKE
ncbi:B-box zinc finger protein [Clostridium sp. 1001271B_151109_B4]|uniref:B-box zinc finger protein n=1 Tax=Clostridium sp. 1001271B_151109_B4 TaxID=2787148 RepID=UPI0018AB3C7C|nr:B-box zinc finger protein [Clostridium sp. 1001271B_151109_B4]